MSLFNFGKKKEETKQPKCTCNANVEVVKTESEQNRCAMACQGCGAVFLLLQK